MARSRHSCLPLLFALAALAPRPSAARARAARRVPPGDRGVFAKLTARVRLHRPSWLSGYPTLVAKDGRGRRVLVVEGQPVAYASAASPTRAAAAASIPFGDRDRDGIPDALDILVGAKKAALNGARYRDGYYRLKYPGGDVPRSVGVCTDVVIRALRNAGFDLQRLVARDVRRRRRAYRRIKKPDKNIDHRRVLNLLVWFRRHFRQLPVKAGAPGSSPLVPGDVIFFDTMKGPAPEHLGIVSDRVGPSGKPLIINNWTVGYHTQEMDLLAGVRATHRFRVPAPRGAAAATLRALLAHYGLRLPPSARQLIVSSTTRWSQSAATVRRFTRDGRGRLRALGRPLPSRLGRAGLGRGRGLHQRRLTKRPFRGAAAKREGDGRSPAGVFALGKAFSPRRARPYRGRWPYRRATARDVWVDDPSSAHYNRWRRLAPGQTRAAWRSAEKLASYKLALIVRHNDAPVKKGAGSAIFLHAADAAMNATPGCTTIRLRALRRLLGWLDPRKKPVLVQLPGGLPR